MENQYNYCFACGKDNPIGLKLNFHYEDGKAIADFVVKDLYQGYPDIIHGGITSTLLDEAMVKILLYKKLTAVTAEMNIRFHHKISIGSKVKITGWIKDAKHKIFYTEGEIKDEDGEILASAKAKYIIVNETKNDTYQSGIS